MNEFSLDKSKENQNEDKFQRYEFSKRIAKIINGTKIEKSLVIGLYGKWGEGKTSVLNFIEKELDEENIIIKFNPWLFSNQDNLLQTFFGEVAKGLGAKMKGKKEKIGEFLSNYAGIAGTFTQFVGTSTSGLKDVGDKMKKISIEKLRDKINQIILDSGKNIVIFIDDIDRLDVQEIQIIFKLVKLVADFPNTTYVLAFDEELIGEILNPVYGSQNNGYGNNFLEKIIQVPLKIPKATPTSLRKYTLALVQNILEKTDAGLTEEAAHQFIKFFDEGIMPNIDNPRIGVRYANTIAFSIPLLKGEVNLIDLIIAEGIKIIYPEFYEFMRSNSGVFLKGKDRNSANFGTNKDNSDELNRLFNEALDKYPREKREKLKALTLEMFPQLKERIRGHYINLDDIKKWVREKRISSGYHFNRYFSYAVQEGDISDIYLDNFFNILEYGSFEESKEKFMFLCSLYPVGDLIWKLNHWDGSLTVKQSLKLINLLAIQAHELNRNGFFEFTTNFGMAAGLIKTIISNLKTNDAKVATELVMKEADPLGFALSVLYSLEKTLETELEETAQKIIVARFQEKLKTQSFFEIVSDHELYIVFTFWKKHDQKSLERKLLELVKKKGNAIKLLSIFAPTVVSYGKGTYKRDITEKGYKEITDILDSSILFERLKKDFGLLPRSHDVKDIDEARTDQELVSSFQHFHLLNKI